MGSLSKLDVGTVIPSLSSESLSASVLTAGAESGSLVPCCEDGIPSISAERLIACVLTPGESGRP